jgi:hypothetical protein
MVGLLVFVVLVMLDEKDEDGLAFWSILLMSGMVTVSIEEGSNSSPGANFSSGTLPSEKGSIPEQ